MTRSRDASASEDETGRPTPAALAAGAATGGRTATSPRARAAVAAQRAAAWALVESVWAAPRSAAAAWT